MSVYGELEFWEDWIAEWNGVWIGKPLTDSVSVDSFVVSCSIINFYKDQKDIAYMVFPDGESVLGFLEYLFLPTAFIGALDYHADREYVMADFAERLARWGDSPYESAATIAKMEGFCREVRELWGKDDEVIRDRLEEWSRRLNEPWLEEPGVGFSFVLHDGPESVIRHRIEWENRGLSDEVAEIRGRPVEVLLSYRDEDVYGNRLLNKQFMQMMEKEFSYSI